MACTMGSRSGEPARSQAVLLASIALRVARRCVRSVAGPPSGVSPWSDRPPQGGEFNSADVGSGSRLDGRLSELVARNLSCVPMVLVVCGCRPSRLPPAASCGQHFGISTCGPHAGALRNACDEQERRRLNWRLNLAVRQPFGLMMLHSPAMQHGQTQNRLLSSQPAVPHIIRATRPSSARQMCSEFRRRPSQNAARPSPVNHTTEPAAAPMPNTRAPAP